ncbi:hypothetical protein MNBD_GAMMA15-797 [hydrothermal vent metagenome]|uniref:PIN domain-containing protein n=1 Tax=hydrothermal vent metagenome TaxID=652676 RepID=A0A3B0YPF7_9ZZZZ
MIGIDTNVLIRYYVDDNPKQHRKAKSFIDSNDIFISSLVLAETYWILSKLYKTPSEEIEQVFTHIKRSSNMHLEDVTVFSRSVAAWKNTNYDFSDALIDNIHKVRGLNTATFDIAASKKLEMLLL